jgi:hypothetical protein
LCLSQKHALSVYAILEQKAAQNFFVGACRARARLELKIRRELGGSNAENCGGVGGGLCSQLLGWKHWRKARK